MSTSVVTLITGLQGNGKTLFTIQMVKELSEKENRQVFYHGINELKLPWTLLEKPEDWPNVPDGSMIVLDEAQKAFRTRATGTKVPAHVEALETLRHRGLTLYLITQHPKIIDSNARQLCGRHLHLVRLFGSQRSTVHEWNGVRENCDKPYGRKDSIKKDWGFPKEVFALYKSAEVHTVKRHIPKKVLMMVPLALLAAGGLSYVGYHRVYVPLTNGGKMGKAVEGMQAAPSQGGAAGGSGQANYGKPMTATEYVERYAPRVAGLDYTAPVYDELTKPVRVPVPAACVVMRGVCKCYSQQGTKLQLDKDQCGQVVENGFFLAFDPEPKRSEQAHQVQMAREGGESRARGRQLDTVDLAAFPEAVQR